MRLTNRIASATEAGIGGRYGASPGDGSYVAGDESSIGVVRGSSAAGLDEGIVAVKAMCHVDALKRDRSWHYLNTCAIEHCG